MYKIVVINGHIYIVVSGDYTIFYRMAQNSVNWVVKCTLKYVINVFIINRIYKNR
jgi:hypothetical protein